MRTAVCPYVRTDVYMLGRLSSALSVDLRLYCEIGNLSAMLVSCQMHVLIPFGYELCLQAAITCSESCCPLGACSLSTCGSVSTCGSRALQGALLGDRSLSSAPEIVGTTGLSPEALGAACTLT